MTDDRVNGPMITAGDYYVGELNGTGPSLKRVASKDSSVEFFESYADGAVFDDNESERDEFVVNADENKEESLEDTKQTKFCTSRLRELAGRVVNNERVQFGIIILIVVNAIMMGIGTFDYVTENETREDRFEKTDKAFLIIFTIELGLQFIYRGLYLFTDGWLVFDFVIVLMSWVFADLQIIRAFRIFRALRLVTHIATLRNLVIALFSVMPRLSAITALLLLVFYIFSVMFTSLFSDLELSDDYFTRLDSSFFTLFVMMTMEWAEVARECMEYYSWAWLPFVAFISISGFIVFNLIIAVVCDAVAIVEGHEYGHDEDGSLCIDRGKEVNQKQRVDKLSQRVASLVQNQMEIQASLENLARELSSR